jgi:hypothetical protein
MFLGSKTRLACKADNITSICELPCLDKAGSSTSHDPTGFQSLSFTFTLLVLYPVSKYHQHTLLFSFVLDVVHHLHIKLKVKDQEQNSISERQINKYSFSRLFVISATFTYSVLLVR